MLNIKIYQIISSLYHGSNISEISLHTVAKRTSSLELFISRVSLFSSVYCLLFLIHTPLYTVSQSVFSRYLAPLLWEIICYVGAKQNRIDQ